MATTSEDTIVEEREELMVSPRLTKHHHPTRRIARFLKPSVTSIDAQPFFFNLPTVSRVPESFSSKVSFNGWRTPQRNWKAWVDRMHSLHQSTWKKAGIYHAVLNSSYEIMKNKDLILGLAEKWCRETKTFMFVWGEVTITLEDVMVLGGYSVLGESVLSPVESRESQTILTKLDEARQEFLRSKSRKADQFGWLNKFKDNGSEIEHEAFLILWLSRFVFPSSYSTVVRNVDTIAIHLARGIRVALAPAVLASIYRDMSLLKDKIVNSINDYNDEISVTVWAPLQLVQIWIWERFSKLRSMVCYVGDGCKPMFARWDKKNLHIDNVTSFLDCASENFPWRPYAMNGNDDLVFCKVYQEKGRWVGGDCLDEEFESWARCLRVSELVGIGGNCIEQYLPHRVAMQFGMDQDIPGDVPRTNATPEIAWSFYTRPIRDVKVYFPSRFSEPYVTARYLEWWNKSTEVQARSSSNEDEQVRSGKNAFSLRPQGHGLPSNETIKNFVIDESRTEESKESVGGTRSSNVPRNVVSLGSDGVNALGLELEARIRKLEEVFAYLKDTKYGHRLM